MTHATTDARVRVLYALREATGDTASAPMAVVAELLGMQLGPVVNAARALGRRGLVRNDGFNDDGELLWMLTAEGRKLINDGEDAA